MTERQKHRWVIVAAIAIFISGASLSIVNPPNLPIAARLGSIIFLSAGGAFSFLSAVFPILAERRPGVRWLTALTCFDFPWVSPLYTDEGMRTLRKARNCFLLWILFWEIGFAIIAAASGLFG